MPKIITSNVYPPIPIRKFDWLAYYDDHETGPQGWGMTKEEAIADLTENYPPEEYDADNSQFGVGA